MEDWYNGIYWLFRQCNLRKNFEKGSRAQLSREVEFSLPCELDADERLKVQN